MPAPYHHGVTIQEVQARTRSISIVPSSTIGIIGTAPIHLLPPDRRTLNRNVLIASDEDKAFYCGADLDSAGYSLNQDIEDIFNQTQTAVIAINVFDPSKHRTLGSAIATSGNHSVTGKVATVTTATAHGLVAGDFVNIASFATALLPLNQDYVKVKAAPTTTTFTFDIDTADIASTASAAGVVKKITWTPQAVTAADIVGAVDVNGNVTGLKVFRSARGQFGFSPAILIAPGFSTQATVAAELATIADELMAESIIDAPAGLTYQQALEGRGVGGSINLNVANPRVMIAYPHVYSTSVLTGEKTLRPFSPSLAGAMAATDIAEGPWQPPSNRELKGIVGVENAVGFDVMKAGTESDLLNGAGIVTVVRDYGTGFFVWGVRSSAFPSNADSDSFYSVRRTKDIMHKSLGYGLRPFLGRAMTMANVDSALQTINGFIRDLIGMGALMPGSNAQFLPSDNSTTQLAQGKITFYLVHKVPNPMETIIIKSQENIDLQEALYKLS